MEDNKITFASGKTVTLEPSDEAYRGTGMIMENKQEETFTHGARIFKRFGDDAVAQITPPRNPRRWRNEPTGNHLQVLKDGRWVDDDVDAYDYDEPYRLALRALVGPPPWEVPAASPTCDESEMTQQETITAELINKLGDQLCTLSNEAEVGFAKLKTIAIGLMQERDRVKIANNGYSLVIQRTERFKNKLVRIVSGHQGDPPCRILSPLADALLVFSDFDAAGIIANALKELHNERTTLQEILKHLDDVKRERDSWMADFRVLNHRAQRLQGEVDRLAKEREDLLANIERMAAEHGSHQLLLRGAHAQVIELETRCQSLEVEIRIRRADLEDKRERLDNIDATASIAEKIAEGGTRDEILRAVDTVMCAILGGGSLAGSAMQCPYAEPMHDHGDGCPSCMEVEDWAREIASEVMNAMSQQAYFEDHCAAKDIIFRHLQARAVYPKSKRASSNEVGKQEVSERTREETVQKISDLVVMDVAVDPMPRQGNPAWDDDEPAVTAVTAKAIVAPGSYHPDEWALGSDGKSVVYTGSDAGATWRWGARGHIVGPNGAFKCDSSDVEHITYALRVHVGPPQWEQGKVSDEIMSELESDFKTIVRSPDEKTGTYKLTADEMQFMLNDLVKQFSNPLVERITKLETQVADVIQPDAESKARWTGRWANHEERLQAQRCRLDGMDLAMKHHVEWVTARLAELINDLASTKEVRKSAEAQNAKLIAENLELREDLASRQQFITAEEAERLIHDVCNVRSRIRLDRMRSAGLRLADGFEYTASDITAENAKP